MRLSGVVAESFKMPIRDLGVALPLHLHRMPNPSRDNVRRVHFVKPFGFATGSKILEHFRPRDETGAVKDRLERLIQIAVGFRKSADDRRFRRQRGSPVRKLGLERLLQILPNVAKRNIPNVLAFMVLCFLDATFIETLAKLMSVFVDDGADVSIMPEEPNTARKGNSLAPRLRDDVFGQ